MPSPFTLLFAANSLNFTTLMRCGPQHNCLASCARHQGSAKLTMTPDQERLGGESPCFVKVLEEVSQIAPLNKPVLIVGERGTGKELIAARLHYLSQRWEATLLKMNCAAISESLLETELFGHEAGAFTGATRVHHGRFERAHGGTLFLDELATTSPLVQEKILRVIEYGEFERLGGSKTLSVDVRLIAATNVDLPTLAEQGKFRADLLDRLAFDVITLPPLRARPEDILLLANQFAVNMANALGRDYFAGFSSSAQHMLLDHPWPGNVRELKNAIERSVYRSSDPDAELTHIVLDPFDSPYRPAAATPTPAAPTPLHYTPSSAPELPVDLKNAAKQFELELLQRALETAQFNQRKAATLLGLTYDQLRGYLRKYRMVGAESRDEEDDA